jgi:hypothetical protein
MNVNKIIIPETNNSFFKYTDVQIWNKKYNIHVGKNEKKNNMLAKFPSFFSQEFIYYIRNKISNFNDPIRDEHIPLIINVINDESDDNIFIEGDNYHSLTVLNYTHKGKIDFIFIAKALSYENDIVVGKSICKHSPSFKSAKILKLRLLQRGLI